ncbi:MAG: RimK family alpha-L-glutamate ligase [Candidatus Dojkabacteria bacterium]
MKIALSVSTKPNHQTDTLLAAAKRRGHQMDVITIRELVLNEIESHPIFTYDKIYWRVNHISPRVRSLIGMTAKKLGIPFVNRSYFMHPMLGHKVYQTAKVVTDLDIDTPRSFVLGYGGQEGFDKISETLNLPFIVKPSIGGRGESVALIKSFGEFEDYMKDHNITKLVFQEYIQNDGDYRIIVVGGKAVGAFKRIPAEGDFRANISQAGSGEIVKNGNILTRLYEIAETTADLFQVDVTGVDVIVNADKYYFLEINTIPQWEGFQGTTGIDIAEKIIQFLEIFNG